MRNNDAARVFAASALKALLTLIRFCLIPLSCSAQLIPCQPVTSVTGYKILLDELRLHDKNLASQKEAIMDLLFFNMENQLSPSWAPIRCDQDHRSPAGEQSFDTNTITRLAERDVILEIWGDINSTSDILLNYVLYPVAPVANPFIRRRYSPADLKSGIDVADWLGRLDEWKGYALLARAVRKEKKTALSFDDTVADLQEASSLLKARYGPSPTRPESALLRFAERTRCQTIDAARQNPHYTGGLKAIPREQLMRECKID